ncbi:MAG: hypothetical protein WDO69_20455 [Pseudomonadota bacterium]
MASTFLQQKQARASRAGTDNPFAEQVRLSRVHTRLVPMRRSGIGYAIDPATADWFEFPAGRGFAGYGLGRALSLLLDALQGLSALHETTTASGEPFAHGEFAPLHFRVDPLGVCRLVPLTTRHYISEEAAPPRAVLGFLSPERLIAEQVGVRADVFSAGVLLWEALAGRRLTEEQSAEAIIERLLSKKLRVPPLPPQLTWATPLKAEVERALSVNQQRRFANCEEFSAVILRLAQDHVASRAEIAEFFANLKRAPSSPPSSPPSSVPISRERLVATRGATVRMLPATASVGPASNSGAAADGARRHATLKMNVTLRMAQVPLPIAVDVAPAPAAQLARAERVSEPAAPLFPRAITPSSLRRVIATTPVPPLVSSLPRSTPPPLPSTPPPLPSTPPPLPSTPPPLPSMTTQSSAQLPSAIASLEPPLPMLGSPGVIAATSLPEAAFVVHATPKPWMSGRRWILAALLVAAIAGVGIVATRGTHRTAAFARTSTARSLSAPRAVAPTSLGAPSCCTENPDTETPASRAPALIPNVEPSAAPATPARGRVAPNAAQPGRDYGI